MCVKWTRGGGRGARGDGVKNNSIPDVLTTLTQVLLEDCVLRTAFLLSSVPPRKTPQQVPCVSPPSLGGRWAMGWPSAMRSGPRSNPSEARSRRADRTGGRRCPVRHFGFSNIP